MFLLNSPRMKWRSIYFKFKMLVWKICQDKKLFNVVLVILTLLMIQALRMSSERLMYVQFTPCAQRGNLLQRHSYYSTERTGANRTNMNNMKQNFFIKVYQICMVLKQSGSRYKQTQIFLDARPPTCLKFDSCLQFLRKEKKG